LEVKVWVRKVVLVLVENMDLNGDVEIGTSVEVIVVREGGVRKEVGRVGDGFVEVARTAEMARNMDASSVDEIKGVVVEIMDVAVDMMEVPLEVRGVSETTRTVEISGGDEMTGVVVETTVVTSEAARTVEISGVDEMSRVAVEVANVIVDKDLEIGAGEEVGDTTEKVGKDDIRGVIGEGVSDSDKKGDRADDGEGNNEITDRNDEEGTGVSLVTFIKALVVALVRVPVPDIAVSDKDTTEEDTTEEDTTEEDTTEEDTAEEDTAEEDTAKEDTAEEDTTEEDTAEDEEVAALLDGSTTTQLFCAVIRSLMSVTDPFNAYSPPATITPAFNEIDSSARMLPAKVVAAPSVAKDPTCQKTLQACAPLIKMTPVAVAVVNVDPIWKTKMAFGLFWPSRTSVPVIVTADAAV
jgi:hypothetical protein